MCRAVGAALVTIAVWTVLQTNDQVILGSLLQLNHARVVTLLRRQGTVQTVAIPYVFPADFVDRRTGSALITSAVGTGCPSIEIVRSRTCSRKGVRGTAIVVRAIGVLAA